MAGIYVHIPFCKSRCIYCGFYSTTLLEWQDKYVDCLLKELELRKDYLQGEPVNTIYLGGGTPSQLSLENLGKLIQGICDRSDISLLPLGRRQEGGYEFTVECNPDDITPALATLLFANGVNRVSMGAQTFSDERLRFIHRRHTAQQIRQASGILREAGIRNISIDLMFGFPGETLQDWLYDIREALALRPQHISAYSLMYEEGTPLYHLLEEGRIEETDEELSRRMYYTLIDELTQAGYEHYEISNFCLPGCHSRHNSSYWDGTHYLGLGAGAHSYDGHSRQWNISDLKKYINKVTAGVIPSEREELSEVTRYNDMITTALRTKRGISLEKTPFRDYLLSQSQPLIDNGLLQITDSQLHLTLKGLYISDDVMSNLIMLEE